MIRPLPHRQRAAYGESEMHELAITQSVVDMVVERTAGRRIACGPGPGRRAVRAWCRMRCCSATSWSPRDARWRARVLEIEPHRARATAGPAVATSTLTDLILLCPCGSADVQHPCRAGAAGDLGGDGGGAMCLTCGCGDEDNVRVLDPGRSSRTQRTTMAPITITTIMHHDHGHDHEHCSPHEHQAQPPDRDAGDRRGDPGQERPPGRAQPGLAGRPRHHRGQPDELARLGQDLAAGTDHRRARAAIGRSASSRATRRPPFDAERIRRAGRPRGPGQHRGRLPPRRADGAAGPRGAGSRARAHCCSSRTSATWSARPCSTSASRPRW